MLTMVSLSAVILSGVLLREAKQQRSRKTPLSRVNSQQRGVVADRIVPEELDAALVNVQSVGVLRLHKPVRERTGLLRSA